MRSKTFYRNEKGIFKPKSVPQMSLGSLMGTGCSARLEPLSNNDDHGSENVAKKMNLRSFKLNRVYLDPLNMSNAGDFSWS